MTALLAVVVVPIAIVGSWPGREVSPWTVASFVALGFVASAIRFGSAGQRRDRYSPGCLVVVTAALIGGPTAGLATAIAAAHRFGDRRADLFWASEASFVGIAAGLVGLVALPLPVRVVAALAAVQVLTLAAIAVVHRTRRVSDSAALKRTGLLLVVELVLAIPLLVLLVRSYRDSPEVVLLTIAALLAVLWIAQRGRDGYLRELSSERERARRDALTGLLNRRGSEEALAQEHARVARGGATAAVLLADFDRFHWINQTYDMAGGDHVLREISRRLMDELRASDIVGRWGGEELIVLAPNLDPAALAVLAEKLRRIVRDTPVTIGDAELTVTCSVGAAMIDGGVNPAVSLQRANRALKHAKERRDTASVDSTYERRTDPSRETQVDALTGLLNRQALSSLVMPREVERATQSGQPLALLIVDLDELKPLNDLFGHATGDLVLTGVADTVTAVVGREELVFRIGGDEFAVLLPLPLQDACDTADAILRAISRRTFATHAPGSGLTQVGVSIGVAVLSGATPASDVELAAQALFTTADDAMYEAKHRGNCWIAKVVGATAEPAVR